MKDKPDEMAARGPAERNRCIAKGRAEAAEAPIAVALTGADGNGGPADLTPLQELAAIAELLYGARWRTDVARDLGHSDGRTVRRWKSGEARVSSTDLDHIRRIARKRAAAITKVVGDHLDEQAKPARDPAAIRAAFEATIAAAWAGQS
ncbi:hypothetical protein AO398_00540 [Methylobacterium sp. GXS13]|nr:hypothetical protein AO398_00540 [Methylobacterium sp. GXS13]